MANEYDSKQIEQDMYDERQERRKLRREGGSDADLRASEYQENIRKGQLEDAKTAATRVAKSKGYDLKARPYDFAEEKYKNPYLADQLSRLKGSEADVSRRFDELSGAQREFRGSQSALVDRLTAASRGEGPSVVQATHRKALDSAIAASRAGAVSSGLSPAMAAKLAAQGTATAATAGARDAAILKAQEQIAARQELGTVSAAARQQDIANAAAQQQNLLALTKYYMDTGMSAEQAEWQAGMELEKQKAQQHAQAQITLAGQPQKPGIFSQIMGGISSLGSVLSSDIRLKENIKDGDKGVSSFLKHLVAKKYDYIEEVGGEKDQLGVMAQDLEKSKEGKKAVIDTPIGKAISLPKSLGLVLASLGHINKRIEKLEK